MGDKPDFPLDPATVAALEAARVARDINQGFIEECALTGNTLAWSFTIPAQSKISQPVVLPLSPRWDKGHRQLTLGRIVVKQFRQVAPNQFLVLDSFEEQNWADEIDDPLPMKEGKDQRSRLADTIDALNDRQDGPAKIRFGGNGSGSGICWCALPLG